MEPTRTGAAIIADIETLGMWAVMVGDDAVPVVSLAPGTLDYLQTEYGARWVAMIDAPLERPAIAEAIVRAAHEKLGVPAPEAFADFRDLARLFVQVRSDVPEPDPFAETVDDRANPTFAT